MVRAAMVVVARSGKERRVLGAVVVVVHKPPQAGRPEREGRRWESGRAY
jgi:hypothetical protein